MPAPRIPVKVSRLFDQSGTQGGANEYNYQLDETGLFFAEHRHVPIPEQMTRTIISPVERDRIPRQHLSHERRQALRPMPQTITGCNVPGASSLAPSGSASSPFKVYDRLLTYLCPQNLHSPHPPKRHKSSSQATISKCIVFLYQKSIFCTVYFNIQ